MLTNTSTILITNVSADGEAKFYNLTCFTDKLDCCQTNAIGDWLLPDGSSASQNESFLVTRHDNGIVQLMRSNNDVSPSGLFCCSIPDADNVTQKVCTHISKFYSTMELANLYIEDRNMHAVLPYNHT